MTQKPYPQPKQTGGRLIREVVRATREMALPIGSHILCAVSAGPDSQALAHLLVKYGRRVGAKSQLRLLHIQHGWRGQDSTDDVSFLAQQAAEWGVPLLVRKVAGPEDYSPGTSWEDEARRLRKQIFAREAADLGAVVMTAHHGDDLAETLLWRLFTGTAQTLGAGILAVDGVERRPLLGIRKSELISYLNEEGISYRNDYTNEDPSFLRARMRAELVPQIEALFPGAIPELMAQGRQAALRDSTPGVGSGIDKVHFAAIFSNAGIRIKRAHWQGLDAKSCDPSWTGEFNLPQGWKLVRERAHAAPAKPLKIQDKLD